MARLLRLKIKGCKTFEQGEWQKKRTEMKSFSIMFNLFFDVHGYNELY